MPEASQPQAPSARLASALLLLLALAWCAYWFVHSWHYWEDDAWIHLEFARSLAAGKGFAFNGRVVAGDTAPLWVFLLVAAHAIIPNWVLAGKTLAALGAVVGLGGGYAFTRGLAARLLPPSFAARVLPAAVVFFLAVNPYTCYWIFSGMESVCAAGFACFAVLAATRKEPSDTSFFTACLLVGVAPLLRPEMVFLSVLLALPLIGQWRRLGGSPLRLAFGLSLAVAPVAIWSAYSLHAFGHVLPNTNAAKRANPGDSVLKRLGEIYPFGYPVIALGVLGGAISLLVRGRAVVRSLRSAVVSALSRSLQPVDSQLPYAGWVFILWPLIAAVFYVANHTYVQTRYILVSASGLMIVILLLALRRNRWLGNLLYFGALTFALAVTLILVRPFIRNKAINCDQVAKLGEFIHDHIPADQAVATYSIGQVAYVSEHAIVDTGGITRPAAIPYLNSPKKMVQWARSQGATYYLSGSQPEPGAVAVYTVKTPFYGWSLHFRDYAKTETFYLWRLPDEPPATGSDAAAHP